MVEKGDTKAFVRKIVPRFFKAAFLVAIVYLPIYFLSALVRPLESFFPWYEPLTNVFTALFIGFLVAGTLFSGTIFQYVCGVARTFVLMLFFIYVLNGGIITLAIALQEATVNIFIDLRVILAMLVLVCLLGIAKNVVQAIDFVAGKAETKEI